MTSENNAYVWVWLPGATEPVVAGVLTDTGTLYGKEPVLAFTYARSYRARDNAIDLFTPELPLQAGTIDPTAVLGPRFPLALAGCLRDSAPDSWGRRVLNSELAHDPEAQLSELTYLLRSDSNRIGALDFQESPAEYVHRGEDASLPQLMEVADLVERGEPIPRALLAAARHGTSIGGARPKALVDDGGRHLVAKFSSAADTRPVVKAEAVGMLLAAEVGISVADVEVVHAAGKDVLLVERFDRPADGSRRAMLSALTILGVPEQGSWQASYVDLANSVRTQGWVNVSATLREMFSRLVLNICIGNNDDHLRNHAAFWDGRQLELTPAYDLCPQPRNTPVSTQAISVTPTARASQLRIAREVAASFRLTPAEAGDIIDHVVHTIGRSWAAVCDRARLTSVEREQLWGREILNDYIFYDEA